MLTLRIICTLIVLGMLYLVDAILFPIGTTIIAQNAGEQLQNSDVSFWQAYLSIRTLNTVSFLTNGVCMLLLFGIWFGFLRDMWYKIIHYSGITGLILFSCVTFSNNAHAYYDKTNWPEPIMIMPNESFFWIPATGANKDTQTKFGSEEYYRENKLAIKYFEVPHTKLVGSSYWADFYVPTGRGIIVPREPYARVWTANSGTGTSNKDQSFNCQSTEGLNIKTDMSIGAHIEEEEAPRYLHQFPVKNPIGDRKDPQVMFTSVYYASGLAEQMDSVIWGFVSKTFCNSISNYPLVEVNNNLSKIIIATEEATKTYMKDRGITLDYLGLAGTLTFSKEVQQAIDDKFRADTIKPVLDVLTRKAELDTMTHWNGSLPAWPNFIIVPDALVGKTGDWLKNQLGDKVNAPNPTTGPTAK